MATTKDEKQVFAEARIAGKTRKEAALIAKPDISKESAAVVGHRLSQDIDVQQAIMQSLEDHGLDYAKVLKPIAEGLEATKAIVMGKGSDDSFVDIVPDWGARLKAADMAVKLLLLNKTPPKDKPDQLTPDQLNSIKDKIDNGDIKALERIVFKDQG